MVIKKLGVKRLFLELVDADWELLLHIALRVMMHILLAWRCRIVGHFNINNLIMRSQMKRQYMMGMHALLAENL
jgi:hypothetical protein